MKKTDTNNKKAIKNSPKKEQSNTNETSNNPKIHKRVLDFIKKHWKVEVIVLVLLLTPIVCFFTVESLRFSVLNQFSSEEVTFKITDEKTNQPLEGVKVFKNTQEVATTDEDGTATINEVSYGNADFEFTKDAYSTGNSSVKIDLGFDEEQNVALTPVGIPLSVTVVNSISQEPLADYTISVEGTEITSDYTKEMKHAELNVPPQLNNQEITLRFDAEGYNSFTQKITVNSDNKKVEMKATIIGRHFFLSNRNGFASIYSSNFDGTDEELVSENVAASSQYIQYSPSPNNDYAAVVSKKDRIENEDGNFQDALYLLNFQTNELKRIDEGANVFSIYGWSDSKIVYTVSKQKYDQPDNEKLKMYDVDTSKLTTLYQQRNVSGQRSIVNGKYIFSNYSYQSDDSLKTGVYHIDLNNPTEPQMLIGNYANSQFYRTSPRNVVFNDTENSWFEYRSDPGGLVKLEAAPENLLSRYYVESPSKSKVAWMETRDGKQTLFVGNGSGENAKQIAVPINSNSIISWINDEYVTISVISNEETANYIVHISSGLSKKIVDVYNDQRSYRYY